MGKGEEGTFAVQKFLTLFQQITYEPLDFMHSRGLGPLDFMHSRGLGPLDFMHSGGLDEKLTNDLVKLKML